MTNMKRDQKPHAEQGEPSGSKGSFGSYLYAEPPFAIFLRIFGEDNAVITVRTRGISWDTRSLYGKWRCGLCDKEYELEEGLLPHIDGRTHKPVCGECVMSVVEETWGKRGVHGR